MSENKIVLPLIPLRGLTIFQNMIMHFDVGREKSIAAIEDAMLKKQEIFLVTQKESRTEDPNEEDIFEIGTISVVKQILKMPGNTMRVLVEGVKRAKINSYIQNENFFEVEVLEYPDQIEEDDVKIEAHTRMLKDVFFEYINLAENGAKDIIKTLDDVDEIGNLSDIVASYVMLKEDEKQQILEEVNVIERVELLITLMKNEIQVLKVAKKIGSKLKKKLDKSQKEYYLREQIKVIQEELGEDDEEKKEIQIYEEKVNKAKLPKEVKERANHEISRLKTTGTYSSEGNVIRTYLDWILDLPWNKKTKDNIDIKRAKEVLDNDHYGLFDVKDRIIEYLAVKKMTKSLKGPILCLVGPPGVGKTSIAKSVAKSINRNFVRMSLGGVRDEAEIRGHRKTYIGAMPGRIIYGLKEAGSNNPLFLLDEIDKMGNDYKGDPQDALLEVLDAEQNSTFRDNYLELPMNLQDVMFITTANSLDTIPRALLDRMEIIEVSGYTYEEKFNIAKKYLVPKQLKENGLSKETVSFSDSSIKLLIENYTRESGVRSLNRQIASVIRKAITEIVKYDKKSVKVKSATIQKYLGTKIFEYDRVEKEDRIGVVTGMAWTAYGGDTLPVEVMVMDGTGKLELTGKLGDVMKESAKAAYTYVRANAKKLKIEGDFYKNKDIHLHAPEGAVPKDGPSAGVTIITALVSALGSIKVKHNVAMTGEITLTGKVLPIGGLKEKCLAAHRAGIDTVIVPFDNKKDAQKIPSTIKSKLKFVFAEKVDDVLSNALIGDDINEN